MKDNHNFYEFLFETLLVLQYFAFQIYRNFSFYASNNSTIWLSIPVNKHETTTFSSIPPEYGNSLGILIFMAI